MNHTVLVDDLEAPRHAAGVPSAAGASTQDGESRVRRDVAAQAPPAPEILDRISRMTC
ncbi:hypothetical protein [Nonomuraea recticatena]|uniref:hypothetical protein n=1 Tax=Nonomuraea recticatena TaxID=46178 RepID=UPI0031F929A3